MNTLHIGGSSTTFWRGKKFQTKTEIKIDKIKAQYIINHIDGTTTLRSYLYNDKPIFPDITLNRIIPLDIESPWEMIEMFNRLRMIQ